LCDKRQEVVLSLHGDEAKLQPNLGLEDYFAVYINPGSYIL